MKLLKKQLIIALSTSVILQCCEQTTVIQPTTSTKTSIINKPSIIQINGGEAEPNRDIQLLIGDYSNNETGFTIERRKKGSTYSEIAVVSSNATDRFLFDDNNKIEMSTEYVYRVKAFNNQGSSEYSNEMSIVSSEMQTSYISIKTTKDAILSQTQGDQNFGNKEFLIISGKEAVEAGLIHSIVYFPMPNIPSYATKVESSYLRLRSLYGSSYSYPGALDIYAASTINSWDEMSVTWNSRPGSYLDTYGLATHNPNTDDWIEIDVSKIVNDWLSGTRTNNGIILFAGNNIGDFCFYYSKEGNENVLPTLFIGYNW